MAVPMGRDTWVDIIVQGSVRNLSQRCKILVSEPLLGSSMNATVAEGITSQWAWSENAFIHGLMMYLLHPNILLGMKHNGPALSFKHKT